MPIQFCTILNGLKSPKNVGMILRSHVAYGGSELIFTGLKQPWQFKKGTRAFSRKLERQCRILHIPDPFDTLNWCKENQYSPVAVEIQKDPVFLNDFVFPDRTAIIVGNEEHGLDTALTEACDHVLTIRQFGNVGSLNVAVSASTAMYEWSRNIRTTNTIIDTKYQVI